MFGLSVSRLPVWSSAPAGSRFHRTPATPTTYVLRRSALFSHVFDLRASSHHSSITSRPLSLHAPPHTTPSIRACLKLTPPPGSVRKSISLSLSLSLSLSAASHACVAAPSCHSNHSSAIRSAPISDHKMHANACTHDPSATRRPPLALVANVLAAHVCSSRRLCAH